MSTEEIRVLMQQQLKLMELFSQKLSTSSSENRSASTSGSVAETIASTITEFHFDQTANLTFEAWFRRFEDLFRVEFSSQDDAWKARLLLRKLGSVEHERFSNFILPKTPQDYTFEQTVSILKEIFGEQSSLFNIRYQCLNLSKQEVDDFVTYAGIVNRECERFKLGSLTSDQFKCLIFVCGLRSPLDGEIRTRILAKIEQDPNITLQQITAECQRWINLKHDTAMIQKGSPQAPDSINVVHKKSNQAQAAHQSKSKKPPSACWNCGQWHFVSTCPFKRHKCEKCKRTGHKNGYCQKQLSANASSDHTPCWNRRKQKAVSHSHSLVANFISNPMSNRKYVSVLINGSPVRMQLDTASDITVLSQGAWKALGKPPVRPTQHAAKSASGDYIKFTGELHCSFEFNGITAPGICYLSTGNLTLLGLDMISKLGLLDVPINRFCNTIRDTSSPTRRTAAKPVQNTNPKSHFRIGDPVYARDYRYGFPKWRAGTITQYRGNVLFEVQVEHTTWIRHRNQLRHRLSPTNSASHSNDTPIPLDVLLDTFDIRPASVATESVSNPEINLQPRRWSNRLRTPVRRMQVNPRYPSYV